jgi:hypothetical protein
VSLRPCLIHSCVDQNKVFMFVEPFLPTVPTKADLVKLWNDAAKALGCVRPKNCRCSYRVTTAEADHLIKHGLASPLITDWRYNEEKKVFFPAPNLNLVWGGKQAEELGLVRSSLAMKTPRVMTIEKANLERAYTGTAAEPNGSKDEQERIEIWGEMAREVIHKLTKIYWPEPFDPFKGCPVLSIAPGWNQRTCIGKDVK